MLVLAVFPLYLLTLLSLNSMNIRRRNMDDISSYLTSRKKSKKMIQKLFKSLKSMMKENSFASKKSEAIVGELQDVLSVTLGLFKALLFYVNGTGSQSSSRSLLSKNQLREMEATIDVLKDGLECFFRRLIKTRLDQFQLGSGVYGRCNTDDVPFEVVVMGTFVIDAAESILVFSGRALHLTSCEPGGGESLSLG
ncbi:hypothetical protein CQW23_31665 [Capsicum baccatum]|uniref:Uncharacterized protein n=1 Tax=Capsicum baccatum TaxID=33114 RepID=A0A2G2V751_CAPBA|nr:hypothetical protein CQW23_31665 [Capsicum baccatum]